MTWQPELRHIFEGIVTYPYIMILCYRDMNMWLVSAEFILRTESVRRCGECDTLVLHVLNSSRNTDHRVLALLGREGRVFF